MEMRRFEINVSLWISKWIVSSGAIELLLSFTLPISQSYVITRKIFRDA